MRHSRSLAALCAALALPAGLMAAPDGAQRTGPTAVPDPGAEVLAFERRDVFPVNGHITITRPGSYLLRGGFSTTGDDPAIRIAADGVALDLGGFSVTGPGNKRGVGVLVDGARGVRLTNGMLASFGVGLQVTGARSVIVTGLQIVGQDLGGAPPDVEIGVMLLNSRGVVLEGNSMSRVFLGIFVRGGGSGGNRITANTLAADANGGLGICYNPAPGLADGPQGDLVADNLISRFGKGIQTSPASAGNIFRENTVAHTGAVGIEELTAGSNVFAGNVVLQIVP